MTPEDEKWVRMPIGFPPELHEWLRETAHVRRTKMAEIVRQAVLDYRAKQEHQMSLEAVEDGEGP